MKEQTTEICLAAVQQCGRALYCIKEQTDEIILTAIKQDPRAAKVIDPDHWFYPLYSEKFENTAKVLFNSRR